MGGTEPAEFFGGEQIDQRIRQNSKIIYKKRIEHLDNFRYHRNVKFLNDFFGGEERLR